ncbi:hypothetical protein LK09_00795 [Microbacterium mangrovi]|uniref:Uncharacterized protein n=1 Tax=Microbacterium mangrovi TaxID=1348253 RepID=A0A0B2A9R1_9MICO|nr:hypothetical protein [Microbacterium mangrovi]KHK99904.1 hypothetical protein LK09_00795 [Microbacterium mangrovi]
MTLALGVTGLVIGLGALGIVLAAVGTAAAIVTVRRRRRGTSWAFVILATSAALVSAPLPLQIYWPAWTALGVACAVAAVFVTGRPRRDGLRAPRTASSVTTTVPTTRTTPVLTLPLTTVGGAE